MKIVRDIVISAHEPPANNVAWLKPLSNGNFTLLFFGTKGWTPVSTESSVNFQYVQDVPDIKI